MPSTTNQRRQFYNDHKAALDGLGDYVGVPPLWLVSVFDLESGLQPNIKNSIGAVGLNQLMPATADSLGIDINAFQNGGADYQISQMKAYYKQAAGRIKRPGDLYMYNFLPAAIIDNVDFDEVLGEKGSTDKIWGLSKGSIYSNNAGLDFYKNGTITRGGVTTLFESKFVDPTALPTVVAPDNTNTNTSSIDSTVAAAVVDANPDIVLTPLEKTYRDTKVNVYVYSSKNPIVVGAGIIVLTVGFTFGAIALHRWWVNRNSGGGINPPIIT